MKGFFIEVSNDLLDPRHCKQMGDSVWLFMWLLDKLTVITQEKGKVLGGKPIKYADIKADLGISRSTYYRWTETLKEAGYIDTVRTPYGSCIIILKAKKRFGKSIRDESKVTHQTSTKDDTSLLVSTTTKNDTSVSQDRHISVPQVTHLSPETDTSNKTIAVDKAVDMDSKTVALAPAVLDDSEPGLVTISESPPEEVDQNGKKINDAITLFLPFFPGDFAGRSNPFANTTTRKAVEALLKRYTLEEVKELLRKYDEGKSDQYRPQVGTVYEFCTVKLAKVEAFVAKKAGKLWAQRSISTPEQSKVRDEQYAAVIEANREKTRLAKEEWERAQANEE